MCQYGIFIQFPKSKPLSAYKPTEKIWVVQNGQIRSGIVDGTYQSMELNSTRTAVIVNNSIIVIIDSTNKKLLIEAGITNNIIFGATKDEVLAKLEASAE